MDTKFLSLTGLGQYDDLIKEYIDTGLAGKSGSTHTHDDRYFTETEVTNKLAGKSDTGHKHTVSEITDLTATATELNYMDGVTSNVQTQIDNITNGTKAVSKATSATYASSATTATNAGTATVAKDAEKLGGQLPSYYAKASDIPTGALADKDIVSESDLDSALAEKVNAAAQGNHSHSNKTVLDGITSTKVSNWDSAESNAKTYADTAISNKTKGMATTATVDNKISTHNASTSSHSDIRTTLAEVKADVDAFFKDATISTEAKDTLKEIQDYITSDATAASEMLASINNKSDKGHGHEIADVNGLQSALDNKANSSHGTHVSWSTTSPKMDGTASVGSETKVARGDHVHPTDTSRASKTEFDTHVASTVSHVTSSERNTWNAKASTASATTATAGLMSSADKTKLDGIATGANKYEHPTTSGNKHIPSGGASGQFLKWSADGTAVWASDNNTTYSAGTGISLSGTTFSNAGVRSVVTGTTNGTIIVNTNGTTASVPVKGLGGAAYTSIDTALSSTSTNAVQNKVVNSAISTLTSAVTANTNSISALTSTIGAIEEITSEDIANLFA